MTEGENRMDVTFTIAKTIPGVKFEIGQILRVNKKVKYDHGKGCPVHLQVEYYPDTELMAVKTRMENCKFKKIMLEQKYPHGQEFTYSVLVKDGIMTFDTSKGEHVEVGDFNFLATEAKGAANQAQFKAGVYLGKSCALYEDPSTCEYGHPDELTAVDFAKISIHHSGEGLVKGTEY